MDKSDAVNVQTENVPVIDLNLTINENPVKVQVEPTARLVDILRDELQLTGTKISCGIGRCGACSVMIDGQLVNACLTMAYQADQTSITTIEGVSRDQEMDPIQKAFLEEGGFQCGYCTPGMVMAVKVLLEEVPVPTEEDIKMALSGNLCRCTGYGGIIRAVQRMAAENSEVR
ncbi:(2Fe-2S)-binding protein [Halobacillus sp. A1]|uniref:(2Fe-2S)-binding protein n=1 Tax=Halobacillus sp. A1 TaxID=2880262 RepID=UPI0020A67F2E|nr:(2Fe-2S)-binding protein [Halobacillus sp. A1]MCP3029910.1 (2Fe-2S)-binding protein [Halobacillus sp. A1]